MPSPSYTQKPFIQLMEQGKEEEYGIPSPVCCGVLAFDLYSNRINIISQQPFPFRSFIKSKKQKELKRRNQMPRTILLITASESRHFWTHYVKKFLRVGSNF